MKKALVIHPFLFAISPVLFLFGRNVGLFHVSVVFGPIAATTLLAVLCWSFLRLLLRDGQRAGLVVSLFFLLFFSHESFFDGIRDLTAGLLGVYIFGTRAYVLLIYTILFALGAYFFIKTRRTLDDLTNTANVVAALLVTISLINIGAYEVKTRSAWQDNGSTRSVETNPVGLEEPDRLPNIYYIILDEYAGADILQELYQYDNTELLDYLTSKGFYIADKSRSNYSGTTLSMASSLNLTYLDSLADRVGVQSDNRVPAIDIIRDNAVFRFLKHYGYEIVGFSSGYSATEIRNADVFMASRLDLLLDEFQWALIDRTPLTFVVNQLGVGADLRRERVLYTFDHLVDVSELEGPIFVFAHILAPHAPFVFGQHGEEIDPGRQLAWDGGRGLMRNGTSIRDQYQLHYANQLIFINSRIEATVDRILATSDSPPIIILQGDTGPASMLDREDADNTYFKERFSILNAYYLPNNGDIHLYDEITPVNTFRVIFNHYFGTDYELLEDDSYFSTDSRPYAFINVTDEMNGGTDIYDPK